MAPVEIALDAALVVMKNGGTTAMAERTFNNVLTGFKKDRVSAVWRLDFVAVHSASERPSLTVLKPIGTTGVNLVRVSAAALLGERVARGELDPADVVREIERVNTLASPYGRWTLVVAAACAGAFFSRISGGDWGAFGIAFVAAGVGQFIRLLLQARKVAIATVTLICGVLSACIAVVALRLDLSQTIAATLTASLIYMAPGLVLINGFFDVVSHKYLFIGLGRIANAAFLFFALSVAIAIAYAVFT